MYTIEFADTSWSTGSPSNEIVCCETNSLLATLTALDKSDNITWFKLNKKVKFTTDGNTVVNFEKLLSDEDYSKLSEHFSWVTW